MIFDPQRTLERGHAGEDVRELQLRLAGFHGVLWDGLFGPGTELQVTSFQREFMGLESPSGKADADTAEAIRRFAERYPLDFDKLRCSCGECGGFGQNRFQDRYREGSPKIEAFHMREYPGIHKAVVHACRAVFFLAEQQSMPRPFITSGYRCWVDNARKNRTSTNHMGKAIDIDMERRPGEDKRDDMNRCDELRGVLVEHGGFQLGWTARNRKSLEPSSIAPTWIHFDVRQYERKYLDDRYFVTSPEEVA